MHGHYGCSRCSSADVVIQNPVCFVRSVWASCTRRMFIRGVVEGAEQPQKQAGQAKTHRTSKTQRVDEYPDSKYQQCLKGGKVDKKSKSFTTIVPRNLAGVMG